MTEDVKQESNPEDQGDDKRGASAPGEGSGIPRERLNEVLAENRTLRSDLDRLQGQVQALQKPSEPQRELTRSELEQAVEDGRMTQVDAGRILEAQLEKRTQSTVESTVRKTIASATRDQRLQDQINKYTAAIPEIVQAGSEARNKIQKEFQYLTSLGHPNSLETEVAALRSAYGPVDLIRSGKKVKETHAETGGGDEPSSGGDKDGWPKDMPAKQRHYYRTQIDKGVYPDMAAAKKEWSYKPQHGPRAA